MNLTITLIGARNSHSQDAAGRERVLKRTREALQSAVKYHLVANSIKSNLAMEPLIKIIS